MKTTGFQSFEEFWPYYLSEHRDPLNRRLHFVGTNLMLVTLAVALLVDPRLLLLCPVVGYGFAWVGHFGVEKNRPATLRHPLWSLMGDFRMVGKMWIGQLWGPARA
ncbi:MAG: Mpo1-like protein [Myxococcota bacterium]